MNINIIKEIIYQIYNDDLFLKTSPCKLPRMGGIAAQDLINLMYCPCPGPAIQEN